MELKLFLLMFLLFGTFIFTTSLTILADTDEEYYKIGIKEDEEFIYICNIFREKKFKDAWGGDWDDNKIFQGIEQGKRMKWKIIETDKDYEMYSEKTKVVEDAYKVEYEIWLWSANEKFAGIESEEKQYSWFINPEDFEEDLPIETIIIPWIPIVSNEYLEDLEFYQWWYVVDGKLIYELDGSDREIWYNSNIHKDDIITETTFNEQGIVSSFKILNEDNEVVLEFSLETELIRMIPFIIIGIAIIAAVAITLIIMKKRGIKFSNIKKFRRKRINEQVKT